MKAKSIFKKVISLFLLLIIVAFSFVSCKSCEDSEEKISLDISEYKIIKPDVTSKDITETISNFKKILRSFTGAELKVESDWYNPSQILDESGYEILIGNTNRTLSAELAKALEAEEDENSFIIKVTDNKIAVLGKNDDTTKKALKYFLVNYAKVSTSDSKSLKLEKGHSEVKTADPDAVLFSNFTEFRVELRSTVTEPPTKTTSGCYEYPTMIKLQYNGEQNGTLLAALECENESYRILKSTDDGATWEKVTSVRDHFNKKYVASWMPFLYELPVDMGNYKAGTVILAATSRSSTSETFTKSTITLYASTNCGESWNAFCNVDTAGGLSWGVWEPFLIYDDGTKRLYCFYSDDSDPDHSQKLVYKYTTDLENWSERKECVACDDPELRPGMISISKMNNGEYVMAFEMVGLINSAPVYIKKTKDLDDWGDVSEYGTQVITPDGISFSSAPWSAWTPAGGECGTLIVVGMDPLPYELTDKGASMLVSFDYGKTFVSIDNPIPYEVYSYGRCGYSPHLSFSEDGSTLYYMNNPLFGEQNTCEYVELVKIKITSIYD